MSASSLSVEQLHQALTRCMAAHPPQGLERALHQDADLLAGLWALMIYERRLTVEIADIDQRVMECFQRWTG